jgi:hypothetical protein
MNSEIIQMTDSMNMMFETHDLSSASPATISRVGMVYMAKDSFGGTQTLMNSWINIFKVVCNLQELKEVDPENLIIRMRHLFQFIFQPILDLVLKNFPLIIPV